MARKDLNVYNEATGFIIASKSLAGRDLTESDSGSESWLQAVQEGIFLPVSLVQDDPFVVRVVVEEPLTAQEEAEALDHWTARLWIPDGKLIICGGIEYLWGEDMEEYMDSMEVPAGVYRADFYTHWHGVNGDFVYNAIPNNKESTKSFFKRTRPSEKYPYDDDIFMEEADYVAFVLRLTLTEEEIAPAPLSDGEENEAGWIPIAVNPRKPEVFPQGLVCAS
jgi:hypothetical protein